jgi:hypothetical protein
MRRRAIIPAVLVVALAVIPTRHPTGTACVGSDAPQFACWLEAQR